MYTEKDYEKINFKIEATQSELNRNESEQDRFISRFGKENEFLLKQHEDLCDEMQTLIQRRHEIARELF